MISIRHMDFLFYLLLWQNSKLIFIKYSNIVVHINIYLHFFVIFAIKRPVFAVLSRNSTRILSTLIYCFTQCTYLFDSYTWVKIRKKYALQHHARVIRITTDVFSIDMPSKVIQNSYFLCFMQFMSFRYYIYLLALGLNFRKLFNFLNMQIIMIQANFGSIKHYFVSVNYFFFFTSTSFELDSVLQFQKKKVIFIFAWCNSTRVLISWFE